MTPSIRRPRTTSYSSDSTRHVSGVHDSCGLSELTLTQLHQYDFIALPNSLSFELQFPRVHSHLHPLRREYRPDSSERRMPVWVNGHLTHVVRRPDERQQ